MYWQGSVCVYLCILWCVFVYVCVCLTQRAAALLKYNVQTRHVGLGKVDLMPSAWCIERQCVSHRWATHLRLTLFFPDSVAGVNVDFSQLQCGIPGRRR